MTIGFQQLKGDLLKPLIQSFLKTRMNSLQAINARILPVKNVEALIYEHNFANKIWAQENDSKVIQQIYVDPISEKSFYAGLELEPES